MPVSVVVGGQYGSEGKGKVALTIARERQAEIVVRVGGTNSGHTAVDEKGHLRSLRQLPVSMFASGTTAVLPPGALIDPEILLNEVELLGLGPERVAISPMASLITREDRERERASGLIDSIGSTGSGTGAALVRRIGRGSGVSLASTHEALRPFLRDTGSLLRSSLNRNRWIVIEGSQGFGLSLLHGGQYPHATSRDTSAAGFVGESGLSPLDVKEIVLVLRAHPIRVAGNSGDLKQELTWEELAAEAGLPKGYRELTTATRKVRRVGRFEVEIVRRAIEANRPTSIVLNHFDYVDPAVREGKASLKALSFLKSVESGIGMAIDKLGTGPDTLIPRKTFGSGKEGQPTSRYSRQRE